MSPWKKLFKRRVHVVRRTQKAQRLTIRPDEFRTKLAIHRAIGKEAMKVARLHRFMHALSNLAGTPESEGHVNLSIRERAKKRLHELPATKIERNLEHRISQWAARKTLVAFRIPKPKQARALELLRDMQHVNDRFADIMTREIRHSPTSELGEQALKRRDKQEQQIGVETEAVRGEMDRFWGKKKADQIIDYYGLLFTQAHLYAEEHEDAYRNRTEK